MVGLAVDDASCRIVVVSSSLTKGDLLVQKLKHLSSKGASPFEPTEFQGKDDGIGGLVEPITVPWSISNRYYNADVHFSLHSLSRAYPAVFKGVPALIITWKEGEPIEEYLKDLRKAMGSHEPDVLLGVRLPGDSASTKSSDEATDSMLISHGFEYIDASRPFSTDRTARDDDEDGIPNLPRVLDALSAFMWPSMTTQGVPDDDEADGDDGPQHQVRPQPTLEYIINRDPFAILQALEELDTEFGFGDSDDDDYHDTFKELAVMENEFPDSSPQFPSIIADDMMSSSPTDDMFSSAGDLSKPFGISEPSLKPKVSLRFDDDFSSFVTAPPAFDEIPSKGFGHLNTNSGRESPDYDLLHSAGLGSSFAQSGSLYRSLGSVSDLGDIDEASQGAKELGE